MSKESLFTYTLNLEIKDLKDYWKEIFLIKNFCVKLNIDFTNKFLCVYNQNKSIYEKIIIKPFTST